MNTRQHVLAAADLAANKCNMRLAATGVLEGVNGEIAVLRGQLGRRHQADRGRAAEAQKQ